jgi:hypothetical protein
VTTCDSCGKPVLVTEAFAPTLNTHAKCRKLIGWRIVRNHPKTGEREWLSPVGRWYPSPSLGETLSPRFDGPWLADRAKHFGGRVVAVYLRVVRR